MRGSWLPLRIKGLNRRSTQRGTKIAVIVEQKVVIPEVRPAHVPMEVLGFEVEGKYIRKQGVQGSGDIGDGRWSDIGRPLQRRFLEGNAFLGS